MQASPLREVVMKLFVPLYESLFQCAALEELGELVPFQSEYTCLRVLRDHGDAGPGLGSDGWNAPSTPQGLGVSALAIAAD